ncbi:MAG: tyrosine-type recombinase/integrase [Verrucomicrobiales bacterium]|nr:tyrosine-type recombinase/integrase [Verrucomicrobiales bacterium]
MKTKSNSAAPCVIRRGSVQVRIYSVTRKSGIQKGVQFFQVADYTSGSRKLVSFGSLSDAKVAAERVATLMSQGETYAAGFGAEERAVFSRLTEMIRPINVPLEVAVSDYVEALTLLGGNRQRLIEAAHFFVQRNPSALPEKTVTAAVAELIQNKRALKASERYLQDLQSRLSRFATSFQTNVSTLTTPLIQCWLEELKLSPQSLKNYRTVLHLFFKFCSTRGYVHRGFNPVVDTESIRVRPSDIEIFTPDEFAKLLAAAEPNYRPCLALQGLAGLRSNEVERIEWSDIDLKTDTIVISRGVAKTASRRTIPIGKSLSLWLLGKKARTGKVWKGTHDQFYQLQCAAATTAGVKWKHNGLRHSYASYRFALVPDAGKIASELGHSPAVLHKHYREMAKQTAAESWFAVIPKQRTKKRRS